MEYGSRKGDMNTSFMGRLRYEYRITTTTASCNAAAAGGKAKGGLQKASRQEARERKEQAETAVRVER